jgi:hypothetical protein
VFVVVFGFLAVVGSEWVETSAEGLLGLAGGVLCIGIDLGLRKAGRHLSPEKPIQGPRVGFMPLWLTGIFWCLFGVLRALGWAG